MLPPGFLPDQIRDKGLARVRDASWGHIVVTGHNKVRVCVCSNAVLCVCVRGCVRLCVSVAMGVRGAVAVGCCVLLYG